MARISAGYTAAWGRRPPRSHPAILSAASFSCVALPPGMACIERAWPRTPGRPSRAQRSASQVPGEDTFDAHNPVVAVGCNRCQNRFRSGLHVPVDQDLSLLVEDAEGPWGGRARRSHQNTGAAWWRNACGLLLGRLFLLAQRQPTPWYAEEGASIRINPLQRTAHSAGFLGYPWRFLLWAAAHRER